MYANKQTLYKLGNYSKDICNKIFSYVSGISVRTDTANIISNCIDNVDYLEFFNTFYEEVKTGRILKPVYSLAHHEIQREYWNRNYQERMRQIENDLQEHLNNGNIKLVSSDSESD